MDGRLQVNMIPITPIVPTLVFFILMVNPVPLRKYYKSAYPKTQE